MNVFLVGWIIFVTGMGGKKISKTRTLWNVKMKAIRAARLREFQKYQMANTANAAGSKGKLLLQREMYGGMFENDG